MNIFKIRNPKKSSAQAMAEFALVLPILLLLIYGLLEVGRAIFIFSSVNTASRQAARYGSAVGLVGGSTPRYRDCTGITAAANNVAFITRFTNVNITYDRGVNSGGAVIPISGINPDPSTASTCTTIPANAIQNGDRIKVYVSAQFAPVIPLVPIGPFTIESEASRTIVTEVSIHVTAVPLGWIGSGGTLSMSLSKTASPTTYSTVGETITYTYTLTNTGTININGPLAVIDDKASVSCAGATVPLPVGASTTCTATYTITQANLDTGFVTNTAVATGSGVTSNQATATITATQTPKLNLTKTVSPTVALNLGQAVTYTYTLQNTGNITLTSPYTITDNKILNVSCAGAASPLLPGQSTACVKTYPVTQVDLDAGSVVNLATATAKYNNGTLTATSNQASATLLTKPLVLTVTPSPTSAGQVGQVITYTYTLWNAGLQAITAPFNVVDNKIFNVDCSGAASPLNPSATTTCVATYTVTQTDMDAGQITTSGQATARLLGLPTTSNIATSSVIVAQNPQLTLTIGATPNPATSAGMVVNYTYTLQNTGNVSLKDFTISDDKYGNISCVGAASPLAPGATTTCTPVSYIITATDLDNGSIINTATATARVGTTGIQTVSSTAVATVITYDAPRLKLIKTANPTAASTVGAQVTYTYTLRNTGNTILTSPYTITDDKIPSPNINCKAVSTIPIGGSTTCTATYTVTVNDIVVGSVTNTATATALANGTPLSSNTASATINTSSCIVSIGSRSYNENAGTMFATITNNNPYPLNVSLARVTWNHDTGAQGRKELKLIQANLAGVTANVNPANAGPTYTLTSPSFAPSLGTGSWVITFTFDKKYAHPETTDKIRIEFSNVGCNPIETP